MLRAALAILVIGTFAPAVFAACWIVPSTRKVDLRVGEWSDIILRPTWSGLVHYGPPSWVYVSSDERVANVEGEELRVCGPAKTYRITGIGPGQADLVVLREGRRIEPGIVNITVVCGTEDPIHVETPVVDTHVKQPATLRVESKIAHRTTFLWYRGKMGDITEPLPASGPEITFTPDAVGTHYVWVQATTPCSRSTGEFRIEARHRKRRSAR